MAISKGCYRASFLLRWCHLETRPRAGDSGHCPFHHGDGQRSHVDSPLVGNDMGAELSQLVQVLIENIQNHPVVSGLVGRGVWSILKPAYQHRAKIGTVAHETVSLSIT